MSSTAVRRIARYCLFSILLGGLFGCQPEAKQAASPATAPPVANNPPSTERLPGKSQALQAKDALFERLSARLVDAMTSQGPAAAIRVCSQEAPQIAAEVGAEQGVRIGRTSFKLRNPENQPPEWARAFVEQRTTEPQFLALEDETTAALLPIKLLPQCVVCHGQANALAPEIKAQLDQLYPNDAATGFGVGDLRGWFWVEVPPS